MIGGYQMSTHVKQIVNCCMGLARAIVFIQVLDMYDYCAPVQSLDFATTSQ